MNRLEKFYLNGKVLTKKHAEQFIYDERGDVNVVSSCINRCGNCVGSSI